MSIIYTRKVMNAQLMREYYRGQGHHVRIKRHIEADILEYVPADAKLVEIKKRSPLAVCIDDLMNGVFPFEEGESCQKTRERRIHQWLSRTK
jgi:hypothetical protein